MQNKKELIRLRRFMPAARTTRKPGECNFACGAQIARAELAFSPSSEKWPGNTFLDVKSRLESIARIGLLKKNDLEVACGR